MTLTHEQARFITGADRYTDAMSEEVHECGCGATFDTHEELKQHVKAKHPDVYEEKFGDE